MGRFLCSGFDLGTWFGVRLRLHWSFALFLVYTLQNGFEPVALGIFVLVFVSVLLHEIGHCVAARSIGGRAYEIMLSPIGGWAVTTGGESDAWRWLWIAAGGPLAQVLIGLVAIIALDVCGCTLRLANFLPWSAWNSAPDIRSIAALVWYFILQIQLVLLYLNVLVPAYPLDGGRLLAGFLSMRYSLQTTVRVAGVACIVSALGLSLLGTLWLPIWLGFEGAQLLSLSRWTLECHPIAGLYRFRAQKIEVGPAVYVAPGLKLVPCPGCGERLHPRSEVCVGCGKVLV